MTEMTSPTDRRTTRRTIDPVLLLAFFIPVLTVAALATVNPSPTEEGPRAPSPAPLAATTLVCPGAWAGADTVAVASNDAAVAGQVRVFGGDDLELRPAEVSTRRTGAPVVLRARDTVAPGLLAARGGQGAGTDCRAPESDVWFAGVGAGPEHSSVLTLANPDAGPALADVRVLTARGTREVSRLRGVAVAPRSRITLDLAALAPERDDVSVQVTVSRGRLASSVADRVAPLGGDGRAQAWLPPAAQPDVDLVLPGVGRGGGERVLSLVNPGEDQVRVELRAITPDSEFSPTNLDPVQIPPGATTTVNVSRLLRSESAADVLGLRLVASAPVTGVLRTRDGNRLVHAVAATPLRERGAVLLGEGPKRLVLAGASGRTDVRVLQRTAAGRVLAERSVTLQPGRGRRVALADRARLVEVVVGDHPVAAVVELGGGTPLVRPVAELPTQTWVPHVGPALY